MFRPHTESLLMCLIRSIIPLDSAKPVSYYMHHHQALDTAQAILLRWGCTVAWCWSVWNDTRAMHFETVDIIVSHSRQNRLYRLDNGFETILWIRDTCIHQKTDVLFGLEARYHMVLLSNIPASAAAVLVSHPNAPINKNTTARSYCGSSETFWARNPHMVVEYDNHI